MTTKSAKSRFCRTPLNVGGLLCFSSCFLFIGINLLLCKSAHASSPGQRSVSLTWTETPACPACTYNVYRGSTTGVCSGTPTPFATGITSTSYTDSTVVAGQGYFYAVSAVSGVESACSAEAQIAVPSAPATPSGLQGQTH